MNAVDLLTAEITREHGLKAQAEWRPAVEAALTAAGAGLDAGPALLDPAAKRRAMSEVIRRITVPETHFFRNAAQLEAAAAHVAEIWQTERRPGDIWCAGSASGEEPYTLAMMLHRTAGPGVSQRVKISGSDLNPDVVERARRAVYTAWSFRGAPAWCLQYFQRIGRGELLLESLEVREAVEFTAESCQAGALRQAPQSLDVVSFRNVAIYLQSDAIQDLHRAFLRVLRPGGLLLLGPSDPRPTDKEFEFVGYRDHAPIFRRRTGPATTNLTEALLQVAMDGAPVIRRSGGTRRSERHTASTLPPPMSLCDEALSAEAVLDPPAQLRLLGLSHMDKGDPILAVAAFRQALFLEPKDVLSRYFYALSLKESGDQPSAKRQLEAVVRELQARAADERLSDGSTRVDELGVSARFMREQWS